MSTTGQSLHPSMVCEHKFQRTKCPHCEIIELEKELEELKAKMPLYEAALKAAEARMVHTKFIDRAIYDISRAGELFKDVFKAEADYAAMRQGENNGNSKV